MITRIFSEKINRPSSHATYNSRRQNCQYLWKLAELYHPLMFKVLYDKHLLIMKSIKNSFSHEISIIGSLKLFRKELHIGEEMKIGIRPTYTYIIASWYFKVSPDWHFLTFFGYFWDWKCYQSDENIFHTSYFIEINHWKCKMKVYHLYNSNFLSSEFFFTPMTPSKNDPTTPKLKICH